MKEKLYFYDLPKPDNPHGGLTNPSPYRPGQANKDQAGAGTPPEADATPGECGVGAQLEAPPDQPAIKPLPGTHVLTNPGAGKLVY